MAECVMICMDNSEYMRNGDYFPNRFDAQREAIRIIAGRYNSVNRENTVGVMSTAGPRVEIHINPTNDLGSIFNSLLNIKIGGKTDLIRAIQTAQIALKHRLNKKHRKQIICFVGSPLMANSSQLYKLGKALRKNAVHLDIISFGDVDSNHQKLREFRGAAAGAEPSNFLECPADPSRSLKDFLLSSQFLPNSGSFQDSNRDIQQPDNDFEMDPELMMAIRLSLNDAQPMEPSTADPNTDGNKFDIDEELTPEIRAALEASMLDYQGTDMIDGPNEGDSAPPQAGVGSEGDIEIKNNETEKVTEDDKKEEIASEDYKTSEKNEKAEDVEMKTDDQNKDANEISTGKHPPTSDSDYTHSFTQQDTNLALNDPNFMSQILSSLKGVDSSDPRLLEIMNPMKTEEENTQEEGEEQKKKDYEESK